MADQGQSAELLWPSELKLVLLGPIRLENSAGQDLTPKARKSRALLALLALSRAPLARSRLADLLWGDRGDEQAKASLRQALYDLRLLANNGYIAADREAIALGPKRLATDYSCLQQAISAGDAVHLGQLLQSIDAPLLANLDGVTPELDEWLRDERARMTASIVSDCCRFGEAALDAGDVAAARSIADGLERIDAVDEQVARLGIRADLAAGDRPGAARRHARFRSRLKDQLDLEPSHETDALLQAKALSRQAQPSRLPPTLSLADTVPATRTIVAATIAILLLIATGIGVVLFRPSSAGAEPMVAVLPFDGSARNDNYFASGVSDEILNLLGHQRRIKVLGRASAAQLAKPAESLDTARTLGVAYLLDGSVRTAADRVLVIARLTRVSDGAQVWSERYERGAGDIFAVQGEIAAAVATRLAQSFAGAKSQETSPEVYDAYLAARQLARQRHDSTLREAERLLKGAIARDPNYAPAFAELAQVIMLRTDHPTSYGPLPLEQTRLEAEKYARRALSLNPDLGEAYAALGFLSLSDEKSEPFYRKAVELDPQRPEFHRWLASSLAAKKQFSEAITEYKRAVAIDPLWGLNYEHLCGALWRLGRDSEAARYEQQFLRLSSDEGAKLQFRASMANARDQAADELAYERKVFAMYPDERQSRFKLASTLAFLGERRQAAKLMQGDPLTVAVLNADWAALGAAAKKRGVAYWEYGPGFWNVDTLLLATGQSRVIVDLYDKAQPLAARGLLQPDKLVTITTAVALSQNGRGVEARRLWNRSQQLDQQLPPVGALKRDRDFSAAVTAAFRGNSEPLIKLLDQRSRMHPASLAQLPTMSLRYSPLLGPIRDDPRLQAIDERIRIWTNAERAKADMPPISKEAWISDPKTVLTVN